MGEGVEWEGGRGVSVRMCALQPRGCRSRVGRRPQLRGPRRWVPACRLRAGPRAQVGCWLRRSMPPHQYGQLSAANNPPVRPLVALAWEVNPLGVAELVAHEAQPRLSPEHHCHRADDLWVPRGGAVWGAPRGVWRVRVGGVLVGGMGWGAHGGWGKEGVRCTHGCMHARAAAGQPCAASAGNCALPRSAHLVQGNAAGDDGVGLLQ